MLTDNTLTYRNGAQKLLGVLITIGEAVAYVVSGMYGDVRELGAWSAILIITQVSQATTQPSLAYLDFRYVVSQACVLAAVLCWHHCHLPG